MFFNKEVKQKTTSRAPYTREIIASSTISTLFSNKLRQNLLAETNGRTLVKYEVVKKKLPAKKKKEFSKMNFFKSSLERKNYGR